MRPWLVVALLALIAILGNWYVVTSCGASHGGSWWCWL